MTALAVARDFELPLELVTEATAIVATRGAGKSSTSAVIVEEGFNLGVQTVVLDRTGVYWGLRSNAKGTAAGLPIYVLGGPHGDVPLESGAGAMIADLVVDTGHSFVLDFSDFSKGATVKFAADFLERLYDRKARSRSTTLLVIDEAHFYAPQTPRGGFKGDSARLMGAMEDVVGLGRSRGLGVVLTTQRTQSLNKAVLDLIETLFVMRMLSPRAREAVRDWIQEKHEEDEQGVIKSLGSLPTGTAWIWSPLRGILVKVAVRRIKTFDSYATPKVGEVRVEPAARKQLDLKVLGEQMQQTAERARANDPAELKKRVRDLETQLIRVETEKARAPAAVETIESPVLRDGELKKAAAVVKRTETLAGRLEAQGEQLRAEVEKLQESLLEAFAPVAAALAKVTGGRAPETADTGTPNVALRPARRPDPPRPQPPAPAADYEEKGARRPSAPRPAGPAVIDNVKVGKGEVAVLEALAEFPEGRTMKELAFLTGYSANASTISAILANLRKAGFVGYGSPITPTAAGLAYVGGPRETLQGDALLEKWLRHPRMGVGERTVLLALLERYPDELTTAEIAEVTGYSPTASTISAILSNLRKLGLVEKRGARIAREFYEAVYP